MKRYLFLLITALCIITRVGADTRSTYTPTAEVLRSRSEFAADRFGIFIHWGIYAMYGQGEWYLNSGLNEKEYANAARGFYPIDFNADEWAEAIKSSGARYITFTTRHHDGFSMFDTAESDYNIVDGTPLGRDVLLELADACRRHDLKLHLYYSHLDWRREDYPLGRTGRNTGRDTTRQNWSSYRAFMDRQLTELLTCYGSIRAIWFDGYWDHDSDSIPFDWQLDSQYALVHRLQPACMVANNHHQDVLPGEDIQIFERDVPGENTAGYSEQALATLPKETCQTMNGMWGYKVKDTDYKSVEELVALLVRCSGMGANLLLNIGPRADGRLPEQSIDRLRGIGEWLKVYGPTIYNTEGGEIQPQPWGVTTRRGDELYVHILHPECIDSEGLLLPGVKARKATEFISGRKVQMRQSKEGVTLIVDKASAVAPDYVITLLSPAKP